MDSAARGLEITVLSAENLRIDGKPVKKNAFVVVKADNLTQKSTKADYEGGSNPCWNERLEVTMPIKTSFITLEVKCSAGSSVGRLIGTARVPVSDFLGDYTPDNYVHFLSYRLRDAGGERNGIVNVSVKVKVSSDYAASRNNMAKYGCSSLSAFTPKLGVPVGEQSFYGGIAIGLPVWGASRA